MDSMGDWRRGGCDGHFGGRFAPDPKPAAAKHRRDGHPNTDDATTLHTDSADAANIACSTAHHDHRYTTTAPHRTDIYTLAHEYDNSVTGDKL